jgi:predicted nucleotidyltransferase
MTDQFHADSDLDLILIKDTDTNFIERPLEFDDILNISYDCQVDLLIYTPAEFEKIKHEKKIGFWKQAFSSFRKII